MGAPTARLPHNGQNRGRDLTGVRHTELRIQQLEVPASILPNVWQDHGRWWLAGSHLLPFKSGERVFITNNLLVWVLVWRGTADRVLSRHFFARHRTVACRGHRLSCSVSAAACFNVVNSQYSPGLKRKKASWLVTTPIKSRQEVAASSGSLSAFSTQMLSTVDYSVGANSRTSDGLPGPCRGGCEKWQLKRGEMRPLSHAQTQNVIS